VAGLAQFVLGAGEQLRGGGGLAVRGDQVEPGLGGLGAAVGGLGPGLRLAAVMFGGFAGVVGDADALLGGGGLVVALGQRGAQLADLLAGLLQRGGQRRVRGRGLIARVLGVGAGLFGGAAGAFVLADLGPGVAGVLFGLGDLAAGLALGAAGGLLGGLLVLARGLGAAFGELGAGAGLGLLAAGPIGVGAGGPGRGERVRDGTGQVGAQRGDHRDELVGQRPEHGLGLVQAYLAAVAGRGGLGRDALAVVAGAVVGESFP
jgi:hypothetical protein